MGKVNCDSGESYINLPLKSADIDTIFGFLWKPREFSLQALLPDAYYQLVSRFWLLLLDMWAFYGVGRHHTYIKTNNIYKSLFEPAHVSFDIR